MTGYRPGIYWQMTWRYIGPAIMFCILISSILQMIFKNPTYKRWNALEVIQFWHFFFLKTFINFKQYSALLIGSH